MGKILDALDANLTDIVTRQPVFFVATAPSGDGGHVNVSPKGGGGSFAVIDPTTVAYLDLTGSGVETIAHLRDNSRITVMFCTFEGGPREERGQHRRPAGYLHPVTQLAGAGCRRGGGPYLAGAVAGPVSSQPGGPRPERGP
jgi:hypothetical protein